MLTKKEERANLFKRLVQRFSFTNFSITMQLFMVIVLMFIVFFAFEVVINFSIKTFLAGRLPDDITDDYYDKLMVYQTMALGLMIFLFGVFAIYIKRLFSDPINEFRIATKEISNLHFGIYANVGANKEYKELSTSINDLSDSLEKVITNLNDKNKEILSYSQELSEQFEAKKMLVSNVSHEIKTPLTVIQTTLMAMKDGIIEVKDYEVEMDNMLKEVQSTISLLQDIIDIYKLDSNVYELTKENTDLSLLVDECFKSFKSQISLKKQKAKNNFKHSFMALVDPKLFVKVIDNILINAIKYSPEGANITIDMKENLLNYELSFTNSDITIPEEEITKLFDPFYRIDKSRKKTSDSGNGLGLFIVKEILTKHGLKYHLENSEEGVTFSIIFEKVE